MRAIIGIVLAITLAALAFGQSAPKFDVTDARASARATNPYTYTSGGMLRAGRYDLRKATMLDLIRIAYGVDAEKVLGGPNWLELNRFDVAGKASPSTPPETVKLMLQALLADRFKLVVHKDTRPLPAFALTMGKDKPKLKIADASEPSGCQYQPQPGYSVFACRNMTMDAFGQALRGMASDYLHNPVANLTGLDGSWDFDLKWISRSQVLQTGSDRVTIFDAIDKQLGLTLESRNVPTPVLVVDGVNEKPTENAPGVEQALPPRPMEFEVAEIKLTPPNKPGSYKLLPSGQFEWRALPMKILISSAWNVDWDHIDDVLAGAPKWIDSRQYDVIAKTPDATAGPGAGFLDDDIRLMLRALLIDRFKMKFHYEDRPVPAYSLVAVKPKLTKADPSNRSVCKEAGALANDPRDANPRLSRLLTCRNMTMAQFAQQLQGRESGDFPNEVADATGLHGAWDFTLSYTPSYQMRDAGQPTGDATSASTPNGGISIFDAVYKQLGLKLEMRKRVMPVLVIDHMEDKPADN